MLRFLLLLGLLTASPAMAHKSELGWQYPYECCGEQDCGEILTMKTNDDGSMTVTTKHGTATFPKGYEIREPGDGKPHACFQESYRGEMTLYCLFLPTGS